MQELIAFLGLFERIGGMAILGYLVYQAKPLLQMFLTHQEINAEADRKARHDTSNAFQTGIVESYNTMRAEGNLNRAAQHDEREKDRDAIERGFDKLAKMEQQGFERLARTFMCRANEREEHKRDNSKSTQEIPTYTGPKPP